MWFLKDALATDELGISVLELEPGGKGMEHAEADSGQEEVYYVVAGTVDIELPDADDDGDARDGRGDSTGPRGDPADPQRRRRAREARAVGAPL